MRSLEGTKHVAFATVNERGEPRDAPAAATTMAFETGADYDAGLGSFV